MANPDAGVPAASQMAGSRHPDTLRCRSHAGRVARYLAGRRLVRDIRAADRHPDRPRMGSPRAWRLGPAVWPSCRWRCLAAGILPFATGIFWLRSPSSRSFGVISVAAVPRGTSRRAIWPYLGIPYAAGATMAFMVLGTDPQYGALAVVWLLGDHLGGRQSCLFCRPYHRRAKACADPVAQEDLGRARRGGCWRHFGCACRRWRGRSRIAGDPSDCSAAYWLRSGRGATYSNRHSSATTASRTLGG